MGDIKTKKVCSFTVSSIHFSIMILPYINKELDEEKNIITLLEGNLEQNIKQVLSKISLNNDAKEKIININWKSAKLENGSIEKKIKKLLTEEKDLSIIIYGSENYISNANETINKIMKNIKNTKNMIVKIINCYKVNDFKENIREILDNHDAIFNTSGEHKKEDIFEGYFSA